MNKLVLIFDKGDEVNGIPETLIFNNELDASEYLTTAGLTKIKIESDDKWFSFSTLSWDGTGKAYWAKHF